MKVSKREITRVGLSPWQQEERGERYLEILGCAADSLEKTLMLGKIEKGATEDEMVGWHHLLNGHEFEQAPGVGDGQGSLVCCSPRGHKESDMTE